MGHCPGALCLCFHEEREQEPGAGPALCSHIQKKASGSGVKFNTFFLPKQV